MSFMSKLRSFTSQVRTRHLQARTLMYVSSLPFEIQKDIGWPDITEKSNPGQGEPRR